MTFQEALKRYRLHMLAVIPLLAGIYYLIVPGMVMDWYKDENYSHGFLVPLIAGYFFWQRWPELKTRLVKPDGLGLVVLVLGLLQLLLGWLASEYFTMRSSLLVLLAGMVLYWFGREILKGMALPLGFLIFMVPIPYIIYDMAAFPLKLFVTKVSVAFLQLSGVVVMREGNILAFPNITLEVADACSGIRSLLSLLALAVAYAFFLQTSNLRRWIIIASAVPIAIATNALRVIVTGFLAQWWGAKAAEGFFHEFAGLMVFALAMALLVAVGALVKGKGGGSVGSVESVGSGEAGKRESGVSASTLDRLTASTDARISASRFAVPAVLLVVAILFMHLHTDRAVPANKPFSEFPRQVAGWTMTDQYEFSANVLNVLKASDYVSRQYKGADGSTVNLYVGYHSGGKDSGGIHSPKHCLPGSGWYEVSTRRDTLSVPGGSLNIVRAVYQKDSNKELFLYWFQMMDKSISDEYSLKLTEIQHSILHQRRDQSFIRISVPFEGDEARATATAEAFIRDFDMVLREFLPK